MIPILGFQKRHGIPFKFLWLLNYTHRVLYCFKTGHTHEVGFHDHCVPGQIEDNCLKYCLLNVVRGQRVQTEQRADCCLSTPGTLVQAAYVETILLTSEDPCGRLSHLLAFLSLPRASATLNCEVQSLLYFRVSLQSGSKHCIQFFTLELHVNDPGVCSSVTWFPFFLFIFVNVLCTYGTQHDACYTYRE